MSAMKRSRKEGSYEKRRHPRHPVRGELRGYIMPSQTEGEGEGEQFLQGTIQDVSQGGLGVLTLQAVRVSSPIQCKLRLARLPCSIPTLAEVRWVESSPSGAGVRIGLEFLL